MSIAQVYNRFTKVSWMALRSVYIMGVSGNISCSEGQANNL